MSGNGTPAERASPLRRWRWPVLWATAGIAAMLLARALVDMDPGRTLAVSRIGPTLSRPLSLLTGLVPVFVGEILIVGYLVWLAALAGRAVARARTGRTRWRCALEGGARRIVRDAGVVLFAFYLLWGLNYARPPLETELAWQPWAGAEAAELAVLAEQAVIATNEAYVTLHDSPDAGEPTALPRDTRELERAVDEGWRRAAEALSLPASVAARYGRSKRPWLSPALARLGIAGIYFPFTAEANVVRDLPASQVPHSMAHEKAHQRGFASEAEAGFLGFVAGVMAPHPLSRYGALLFAQRQLLSALAGTSPDEARRLADERLPGVRRDLRELAAYVARHSGPARAVGTAVNDRYLRANRVPGGVRNYGHATRLLIAWSRTNGGSLLPATATRPTATGPVTRP